MKRKLDEILWESGIDISYTEIEQKLIKEIGAWAKKLVPKENMFSDRSGWNNCREKMLKNIDEGLYFAKTKE